MRTIGRKVGLPHGTFIGAGAASSRLTGVNCEVCIPMLLMCMHRVLHVLNSRCNVVECQKDNAYDIFVHASCITCIK